MPKLYNNVRLDTAHDVRTFRQCEFCRGLGHSHSMIFDPGTKKHSHGRCYIATYGVSDFLCLPQEQTDKMTLGDIGVPTMKLLLDKVIRGI